MGDSKALKSCPHCDGGAFVNCEGRKFWVECRECGAESGCYRTADAAAEAWNARHRETCEYKPMWNDDDLLTGEYVGHWWTGCGDALVWNADNDKRDEPPAFCPYCGAEVMRHG